MTNVYGSPEKVSTKSKLFAAALTALEAEGWKVEREPGGGSSVRRISRNGVSKIASIRTTQDQWIAFPRTPDDAAWVTLSNVDVVVASSVDDAERPEHALVHMLDGDEMRRRFDRAYAARKAAGRSIPIGRGVWVSLYDEESPSPVSLIGAGAGNSTPPIAKIALTTAPEMPERRSTSEAITQPVRSDEGPLTIADAKRRLAMTLGVDPSCIKISVEA